MEYNSYIGFDIYLTEKEYEVVKRFCQVMDTYMNCIDDYQKVYEFIEGIAWDKDLGHNKINIVKEK